MLDKKILWLLIGGAGVAYWLWRQNFGSGVSSDYGDSYGEEGGGSDLMREGREMVQAVTGAASVDDAFSDPNVKAMLMLIRSGESTTGQEAYNMVYGGGRFESFADHPRQYFRLKDGRKTSAAGAYQIVASTWDWVRDKYNLTSFSPDMQDYAAVALIKNRGALDDVIAGRFETAIKKLQKEWTSLPGAMEMRYNMATALGRVAQYGGTVTG